MVGGRNGTTLLNDSWYSYNGLNWILANDDCDFPAVRSHRLINFDSHLWLIGGVTAGGIVGSVWKSPDGVSWSLVNSTPPFFR